MDARSRLKNSRKVEMPSGLSCANGRALKAEKTDRHLSSAPGDNCAQRAPGNGGKSGRS